MPTDVQRENMARNAPALSEREIPVAMLGISVPHLVRPLSAEYIAELGETDEMEWEPIEVRLWPASWSKPTEEVVYHVVSGNHRTSAARLKGVEKLRARIIEANDELSYLCAAIRTNTRHGRNFSGEERRKLVAKLREMGQSSRQIAHLFGVSKSTIDAWLSGRDTNASRKKEKQDAGQKAAQPSSQQEWLLPPQIAPDARIVAEVGQCMSDAAATLLSLEKTALAAWIDSLSPASCRALSKDVDELLVFYTRIQSRLAQRGEGK